LEPKGNSSGRGVRALLWWVLAVAYLAVIFIAAWRPEFGAEAARQIVSRLFPTLGPATIHGIVVGVRKSLHFLGYAAFAIILANAFLGTIPKPRSARPVVTACVIAGLAAVSLAVFDEALQARFPHRSGNPRDIGIDILGIAVGVALRLRSAL
jgi:VanZ family protein